MTDNLNSFVIYKSKLKIVKFEFTKVNYANLNHSGITIKILAIQFSFVLEIMLL